MINYLSFLERGNYTQSSELIKEIVDDFREDDHVLRKLRNYVYGLKYDDLNKFKLYRKRSGDEIIKSGFVTGCTDSALAFIVLSRELGIPTKYVETVSNDWLKDKDENHLIGHIFVDIFFNGFWRAYEPMVGFLKNDEYYLPVGKFSEIGKGLDFSELYLKEGNFYSHDPVNLDSLEKMAEVFKKL